MSERFLTTHAGSLPRLPELNRLYVARNRGDAVDEGELTDLVRRATDEVVSAQARVGIDIAGNGEAARESFFTYVWERLSGFGGRSNRQMMADMSAFPSYVELKAPHFARESVTLVRAPACVGEVHHLDLTPLDTELDLLTDAVAKAGNPFSGLFCTAASPGIVATAMQNSFYPSLEEYVDAVAAALTPEYRRIVNRGFALQIDAPDLAMERHTLFADRPLEDFLAFAAHVIRAINRSIAGLPPDQIRLHVCWGNYDGPHHLDVPLDAIIDVLAEAAVGQVVLALANPRHSHERKLLTRLPGDVTVVAGVIDTTTNYVEHPEVVAERIEAVVRAVDDPDRVVAGTDCGFATAAGLGFVADEVVWLKLRSLVEGAEIASGRLL
jgi:5-methyltetrahydropteroyltriglutamate--homocysteine methyltransferase